jgi:hypothetical protein
MGSFKKSSSNDIMIRTEFKSYLSSVSTESSAKEQHIPKVQQQQVITHNKVSLGKPSIQPNLRPVVQKKSPVKQMRGVEIDESF